MTRHVGLVDCEFWSG